MNFLRCEDEMDDLSIVPDDSERNEASCHDVESSRQETVTSSGPSSSAEEWAYKERTAVKRTKYVVVALLAGASIACGWLTYSIVRGQERKEFEEGFRGYAKIVSEISDNRARAIFHRLKNIANTISSFSQNEDWVWPFVSVHGFVPVALQTSMLLHSPVLGMAPIVRSDEIGDWEDYSVGHQDWLVSDADADADADAAPLHPDEKLSVGTNNTIGQGKVHQYSAAHSADFAVPIWQMASLPYGSRLVNFDLISYPPFQSALMDMMRTNEAVLSTIVRTGLFYGEHQTEGVHRPHSVLFQPILESLHPDSPITATLFAFLPWGKYLENLMPLGVESIVVVVKNTCGEVLTFALVGPNATFLGEGDLHDNQYDDLVVTESFDAFLTANGGDTSGGDYKSNITCAYSISIYPTEDLEVQYQTPTPILYTTMVVFVFFCTTAVFFMYDNYVTKHQEQQANIAIRSNAIISSMFPSKVRHRIMKEAQAQIDAEMAANSRGTLFLGANSKLKNFLYERPAQYHQSHGSSDSPPIADTYKAATVLFADIVGFTAWSSMRSPENVFILLETLYHSFDQISVRRRVYKVETIGDCFVAAAGVPEPREDHAVVMARFAKDLLRRMNDLTKRLEVHLGPDTGDLSLRVGMHSGSLTGGVLRGDKARFQLFGRTVDKASEMERTSLPNRIQVSQETGDLLTLAGKAGWLHLREDKDPIQCEDSDNNEISYWLDIKQRSSPSTRSGASSCESMGGRCSESELECHVPRRGSLNKGKAPSSAGEQISSALGLDDRTKRLVDWISKSMEHILRHVVARRIAEGNAVFSDSLKLDDDDELLSASYMDYVGTGTTVISEVQEIIELPQTRSGAALGCEDIHNVQLESDVIQQLHDYVALIASMYKANPFHNFDHASHVCMSVNKLLSRIVAPDEVLDSGLASNETELVQNLHDHTHGITSDPLTQFAVVFSALIHDVDHDGVPNAQLVKEETTVAKLYNNQAVAEQNSIDIAFEVLQIASFAALRRTIHGTIAEKRRFRQLVVNSVIATDIADKQLKELRNARWDKAFAKHKQEQTQNNNVSSSLSAASSCHRQVEKGNEKEDASSVIPSDDNDDHQDVNRKATIVIEHLIQASDVAHTMQHWLMYRKWNEKLFGEMVLAYQKGRAAVHPAEFWYHGELGFFDFYIIPLAKKLKECGVFGVSSDEYLNYALMNRREWQEKGQAIVEEMKAKYDSNRQSVAVGVGVLVADTDAGADKKESPASQRTSSDQPVRTGKYIDV